MRKIEETVRGRNNQIQREGEREREISDQREKSGENYSGERLRKREGLEREGGPGEGRERRYVTLITRVRCGADISESLGLGATFFRAGLSLYLCSANIYESRWRGF